MPCDIGGVKAAEATARRVKATVCDRGQRSNENSQEHAAHNKGCLPGHADYHTCTNRNFDKRQYTCDQSRAPGPTISN